MNMPTTLQQAIASIKKFQKPVRRGKKSMAYFDLMTALLTHTCQDPDNPTPELAAAAQTVANELQGRTITEVRISLNPAEWGRVSLS